MYPEPFQMVALDTSYFTLFGFTFYQVTIFEMGGGLNLITRLFLREETEAVVAVLEEFLARYPGVQVVVIDRGSPYLNETVRAPPKTGSFFPHEIERLKRTASALCDNPGVMTRVVAILEELAADLQPH